MPVAFRSEEHDRAGAWMRNPRSATEAFPLLGRQAKKGENAIDAFRSEGFSSADSTRIHSGRIAW
jgi:hypothetical protein